MSKRTGRQAHRRLLDPTQRKARRLQSITLSGLATVLVVGAVATSGVTTTFAGVPPTSAPVNAVASVTPTPTITPTPSVATIVDPGMSAKPQTGGVRYEPHDMPGTLSGKVIVIDPGHTGGFDRAIDNQTVPMFGAGRRPCSQTGTQAKDKTTEHALAWAVGERARDLLIAQGATVVMTRNDDTSVAACNNERAEIANNASANLMLSIHFDGADSPTARGYHVIWSDRMAGGKTTSDASLAAAHILAKTMGADTTIPASTYAFDSDHQPVVMHHEIGQINGVRVAPAILLEAGNIRQDDDLAYAKTPEGQDAIAHAIADAAAQIVLDPAMQPAPVPASPSAAAPSLGTSVATPVVASPTVSTAVPATLPATAAHEASGAEASESTPASGATPTTTEG